MILISEIFFAVVVTTLTGMMASALYRISARYWKDCKPELRYGMFRLTCLLYFVPLGYALMQLTMRNGYIRYAGVWQTSYEFAGILWVPVIAVVCIWLWLTVRCVIVYYKVYRRMAVIKRDNVPTDDRMAADEFLRVKKKLRVRRVKLYQNRKIDVPITSGVLFRSVMIPHGSYTREELSVIFHHELIHVKYNDIFYRLCVLCITTMYHLFPFIKSFENEFDEWCEYHCDLRALEAIRDEMKPGRYFEVIVDRTREIPDMTEANYVFSMLYQGREKLERRIEYMKKHKEQKRVVKGMAVLFSFTFVLLNVTTIYAAGGVMAKLHDKVYQAVESTDSETIEVEELEEVYLPAEEDHSYDRIEVAPEVGLIAPILDEDTMTSFNWTVSPGTRTVSTAFYVKSGQKISIAAMATPSNVTYWIGIQDSWNNVRYVEGTNSLSHDFEISSSGYYRVLVQNKGTSTITAAGSYKYYTP